MAQYQSFGGVKGGSNSDEKLERLKLQRLGPLTGKSVLDLGCNEGFFCGVALEKGATRVVGIDRAPHFLEKAKERFPKAEFRRGSWWDVPPNEKYDVILFLSAVHYEVEQRRLFDKILNHLSPTGTLVLECGLAPRTEEGWIEIYRVKDPTPRKYPSFDYLVEHLLPGYAVTNVGLSVMQKGDPITRHVLHCRRRKPMVMIVTGASGDGKSLMTAQLKQHGVPVYRTDALFRRLLTSPLYSKTPLAHALIASQQDETVKPKGLVRFSTALIEKNDDLIQKFAGLLCNEAPLDAPMSVIEGEIFRRPKVLAEVTKALEMKGIDVWQAGRSRSETVVESGD